MQESRLFKIVYHLVNKGISTAPELAEKFEVSVRTIYRDIDALSSAGIPIYAMQGKGGGIAIADDFVLDKSLLSAKEKEQVLMALQGLTVVEEKNTGELLTKLGSLFQTKNTNWIEVDFSNWVKGNENQTVFEEIKKAVFGKNIMQFLYFGSGKKAAERSVVPLKLVFKSKAWYLYGYCLQRNDYRFFKLTRMKQIEIQDERYSGDIEVPQVVIKQTGAEATVRVTLRFDKNMAFRVYDEFTDDVTEDESGYLYVHTLLPDNERLYSYLFSFSDSVEVLEPLYIRERLKEKLENMLKRYIT